MRLFTFTLFALLGSTTTAVWAPKGDVHAHEAPEHLFAKGDTNKDDFLDAEELKDFYTHDERYYHGAAIATKFGGADKATEALDTDKDGKLSADEFLSYASPAHASAVAEDDFDENNANKDESLDLEEYKNTHYGKERVIDNDHGGFQNHFTEIDADKDGKITKKEWLGSPAAQDPFTHMDYNNDMLVDFDEFVRNEKEHYHGLDHDSEDAMKHSREAFDGLDKNKDGTLTRAEDRAQTVSEDGEYEKLKFDDDADDDDVEEEAAAEVAADEEAHPDL